MEKPIRYGVVGIGGMGANHAKKLKEKGLNSVAIPNEQIIGKYISKDIKNKNGEILIGAGFDITEEQLEKIITQEEKELNIVLNKYKIQIHSRFK